ncbi:hypothetical protein N7452_010194 [Penicillium brevicompactum]|uniref:Uncharacterized protein n=1 Tax=Penicillium brevicompactum TaxID=5074 RepID=A0A9W9Q9X3_PENBR|nr:hypothetical protein N7452_010194 [Penicillium brevicompactum]
MRGKLNTFQDSSLSSLSVFDTDQVSQIKGSADKGTGKITAEFGVNVPGVGYQSIKPFAGSLHDGVGGDITVFGAHGKFIVKGEGNGIIAQLNIPTGGYQITLLEWERHVAGNCSGYQISCYIFDSLKTLTGELEFDPNSTTKTDVFRPQVRNSMPHLAIQFQPAIYFDGEDIIDVVLTLSNTEKLIKGGMIKGSVKNHHLSITLYNDETNAKIEGALGEGVKLMETDFKGIYGPN